MQASKEELDRHLLVVLDRYKILSDAIKEVRMLPMCIRRYLRIPPNDRNVMLFDIVQKYIIMLSLIRFQINSIGSSCDTSRAENDV